MTCGEHHLEEYVKKALRSFEGSFINANNEIILNPRNNLYFRLDNVESELEFKCKMFAWVSRPIANGLNKYWAPRVLKSFNNFMGTEFRKDDMYQIYDRLGNDVNLRLITINKLDLLLLTSTWIYCLGID